MKLTGLIKLAGAIAILPIGAFALQGDTAQTGNSGSATNRDSAGAVARTEASPQVVPAPAQQTDADPQSSNPLTLIKLDSLQETAKRPLFSPTRRPRPEFKPPAPRPAATVRAIPRPEKPNPFELHGTVQTKSKSFALLKDKNNNRFYRLGVGEQAQGWTVFKVRPHEVVFRKGTRRVTLGIIER